MMKIYYAVLMLTFPLLALADVCGISGADVPIDVQQNCQCVKEDQLKHRNLSNGLKLAMVCDYHKSEKPTESWELGSFIYLGKADIPVTLTISRFVDEEGFPEEGFSIESSDKSLHHLKFRLEEQEQYPSKAIGRDKNYLDKRKCGTWQSKATIEVRSLTNVDYDSEEAGMYLDKYKIKYETPFLYSPKNCK